MVNTLLYIATVIIWGSTWYAIDYQLGVVDPSVSLAYRFLIAAALAFAWCVLTRRTLAFSLRTHGYFLLLGAFLFGLNYLSAYQAQFYISSALNAIGFSSMIWINIINARLFFGRRATASMYVGALLGVAGILIIFLPQVREISLSDRILTGMFFSILGTLFASFGNIASQYTQSRQVPVMQANAWGMLYGACLNGGIALAQGKDFNFDPSPAYSWSLAYLAVIGSVVAFGCYLTLLGRIGLERAGYAAIMIPVVALGFSVVLDDLDVSTNLLAGLSLAVVGNVFILARGARA
jgi:drug/metabolite transporter (DMT)-like permease